MVNEGTSGATKEEAEKEPEVEVEIDLAGVISLLESECNLVDSLFENLKTYCELVKTKIALDQDLANEKDPKLLFLSSDKNSHYTELQDRLKFISLVVSVSDFKITQAQLKVIYDLLSSSPVVSDQDYFLEWCRTTCKDQTAANMTLDLEMVGTFLSDMISNKDLDLARLPLSGFQFVSDYFLSLNESNSKLAKLPKVVRKTKTTNYGYYGTSWETTSIEQDDFQPVKVLVNPAQLDKIDMIWQIVLYSQNQNVTSKAGEFLIQLHTSMADELKEQAPAILQSVIDKGISLV